jgi:hypothetical protein
MKLIRVTINRICLILSRTNIFAAVTKILVCSIVNRRFTVILLFACDFKIMNDRLLIVYAWNFIVWVFISNMIWVFFAQSLNWFIFWNVIIAIAVYPWILLSRKLSIWVSGLIRSYMTVAMWRVDHSDWSRGIVVFIYSRLFFIIFSVVILLID